MSAHCPTCPNRHRCPAVPPTLNAVGGRSDLLIVGEGPGKEEVRAGKGFQGPSGRLLRTALLQAGFDDSVIASLTNATLCLPPKEGVSTGMISACRERLLAEMEAVNPKVVLALGRWAMHALTGKTVKITNVNGLPREWSGRWLVPAIHPASVLRHGNEMSALQTAVDVAMNLVRGGADPTADPGPAEETTVYLADTRERLLDAIHQLWRRAEREELLLGADIETTGLNPRSDRIIALGLSWGPGKALVVPGELVGDPALRLFLESPGCRFAWHNGQFDVGFLRASGIKARIDEDSLLLHYCLNEQKGTHGLEQVAAAYLGTSNYKDAVGACKKGNWESCPAAVLHEYLARDCDYTRQLVETLGASVRADEGLERLYRGLLLPAADMLVSVSGNGFYFSPEEAATTRERLEPARQRALERVGSLAPGLHPASQPQVYALLYGTLRLRPPPKFERTTTAETLRAIAASGVELVAQDVIEAILAYREAAKSLSNVAGLKKHVDPTTGRVHSYYPLHSTVTGRLSSREPNLQNVPSDLRALFQAPPGRLLLETDLDQAELRVLANLSGDEAFAAIYREGKSLHKEVATALYGADYSPEQYRQAKAYSFGLAYGRGAESLVREFGSPTVPADQRLTITEARERIEKWAARFPQAWGWLQEQKARIAAGTPAELRSPTGRARRFAYVNERNLADCRNEASNFCIQATASDICLLTVVAVRPFVEARGGLIVNLVHDSIIFEIPDDPAIAAEIARETAAQFRAIGASLVGDKVPITCEWKLGQRWGTLETFPIERNPT